MPPPVEAWPARELSSRVFSTEMGRGRKGFDGDLKKCELLSLLQYRCQVDEPADKESTVRCWPVERLFRRCQERRFERSGKETEGSFMVETTAWEDGKRS